MVNQNSQNVDKDGKILSLEESDNQQAREFYFSTRAYCTFSLPPYFNFQLLLSQLSAHYPAFQQLTKPERNAVRSDVANYTLLWNKDNAYAWRPMQLVHPALYANLAALITDENNWEEIKQRFSFYKEACQDNVEVASLPRIVLNHRGLTELNINSWWSKVEQESIRLSLEYKNVTISDITNCYGSIYTHTIAWALYDKDKAKEKRNDYSLLGNQLDAFMQNMNAGQTNGIPQGNEISNLIAELILGYADRQLVKNISESHPRWEPNRYKVLRYRDDYRIFTNTVEDGNEIMLQLTGVLADLNLKINSTKTKSSNDIITACIKSDKIDRLCNRHYDKNLQKNLLLVRESGKRYPNSGSLHRNLRDFRQRLDGIKTRPRDNDVLIPIVVDIMRSNSSTYPTCASIISKLLDYENDSSGKVMLISKIIDKFKDIPNINYLEIWLQRISISVNRQLQHEYNKNNALCKLGMNPMQKIWENEWIQSKPDVRVVTETMTIMNSEVWNRLSDVIPMAETEIYVQGSYPG